MTRLAPEVEFARWHVWRSDKGRWWATRTGRNAQLNASDVPMTVDARSEEELRELLNAYR